MWRASYGEAVAVGVEGASFIKGGGKMDLSAIPI